MGLRHDFDMHRNRTVEAFRLVRFDISNVQLSIEHIKNMVNSLESNVAALNSETPKVRESLNKFMVDINSQHDQNAKVQSKFDSAEKSVDDVQKSLSSLRNTLNKMLISNKKSSKNIANNTKSITKLQPNSKKQSLKIKNLDSTLRKSQDDVRKIKNFLNRKFRIVNRRNNELESRIKGQRKTIISLNSKIKLSRSIKATARRRITRRMKPRKTVRKTITPSKVVTETRTPTRTTITEVRK